MKKKKQETLYGLLWKQLTPSQPNLVHFASIKVFLWKSKIANMFMWIMQWCLNQHKIQFLSQWE